MTTGLAFSKKQAYFSNKIKDCPTTKALYSCIDRLLDRKEAEVLPSFDSPKELATQFNDFFKKKIHDIRKSFPANSYIDEEAEFSDVQLFDPLVFRPATLEEIQSIVSKHGV